jgi:hypothetical protein
MIKKMAMLLLSAVFMFMATAAQAQVTIPYTGNIIIASDTSMMTYPPPMVTIVSQSVSGTQGIPNHGIITTEVAGLTQPLISSQGKVTTCSQSSVFSGSTILVSFNGRSQLGLIPRPDD